VLPFGESFAAWAAATVIPAFVGLLVVTLAGRRLGPRIVAGFAFGVFLWFFVDTIEGSADLDLSSGLGGGASQLAMVVLFIAGLLLFFAADRDLLSLADLDARRGLFFSVLAAVAVGIHGFGEGTAFGATAYSTPATSLLGAFGGTSGGAAYALHKMLEPMMVGALYVAYADVGERRASASLPGILLLTLAFAVPSLLGALTGYFISYDATYFFALGAGTSIYVAFRLVRQVFVSGRAGEGGGSLGVSVAVALGFILIYLAALLHS
jgi:hypothetical protein